MIGCPGFTTLAGNNIGAVLIFKTDNTATGLFSAIVGDDDAAAAEIGSSVSVNAAGIVAV